MANSIATFLFLSSLALEARPCGELRSVPRPADAVALDAHVWIEHPPAGEIALVSLDPVTEIPIVVHRHCNVVELEPVKPLLPAKRYEARVGKQLLATFTTGLSSTSKIPSKPELTSAKREATCDAIAMQGKREAPLYAIWDKADAYGEPPIAIATSLRVETCTKVTASAIFVRPMSLAGELGDPVVVSLAP